MARQSTTYTPLSRYLAANAPGVQAMAQRAVESYTPTSYELPTEITPQMIDRYGLPENVTDQNLQVRAAGAAYPEIREQTPSQENIYSRALGGVLGRGTAGERRLNLALLSGNRGAITEGASGRESVARQAALSALSGMITSERNRPRPAPVSTAISAEPGAIVNPFEQEQQRISDNIPAPVTESQENLLAAREARGQPTHDIVFGRNTFGVMPSPTLWTAPPPIITTRRERRI